MRGIMTGCHVPLTEGAGTSMGREGEGGEGGEVRAGESQDAFIDQLYCILWLFR